MNLQIYISFVSGKTNIQYRSVKHEVAETTIGDEWSKKSFEYLD